MMTPLHYAAKYAKMEAAMALIDHGADPTIPGDDGCLPLHFVVKSGITSLVEQADFCFM